MLERYCGTCLPFRKPDIGPDIILSVAWDSTLGSVERMNHIIALIPKYNIIKFQSLRVVFRNNNTTSRYSQLEGLPRR